tara:strand:+ start:269 stop:529 length:261 start_codon:yes stop_codon:yes gene_type:complete
MMLKNDGFALTPTLAIIISISLLIGSWFVYDFICKNIEDNKQELLVSIGFVLFVLLSYFLTENIWLQSRLYSCGRNNRNYYGGKCI